MKVRYLPLLVCILLAVANAAHACSCVGRSVCGALKPDGTLFLGEVVSQRNARMALPWRADLFRDTRVFRVRVVETFSGAPRPGDEVEIRTGLGDGDCGYPFLVGQRYLVDASDNPATSDQVDLRGVHLSTSICSRTEEEALAGLALRELRTALAHRRQPDLHGSVRFQDGPYALPGWPLVGTEVILTAKHDVATYQAKTDSEGIYTFPVLPPDEYQATVALQPHQRLILYADSKPLQVSIPASGSAGLACHLNVTAGPTGGVQGRVVNAQGKPLQGFVTAHQSGTSRQGFGPFFHEDVKKGSYKVEYLPDGEYDIDFLNYSTHMRGTAHAAVHDGFLTQDIVIVATQPATRSNERRN